MVDNWGNGEWGEGGWEVEDRNDKGDKRDKEEIFFSSPLPIPHSLFPNLCEKFERTA